LLLFSRAAALNARYWYADAAIAHQRAWILIALLIRAFVKPTVLCRGSQYSYANQKSASLADEDVLLIMEHISVLDRYYWQRVPTNCQPQTIRNNTCCLDLLPPHPLVSGFISTATSYRFARSDTTSLLLSGSYTFSQPPTVA
jgi:hypothetical protein